MPSKHHAQRRIRILHRSVEHLAGALHVDREVERDGLRRWRETNRRVDHRLGRGAHEQHVNVVEADVERAHRGERRRRAPREDRRERDARGTPVVRVRCGRLNLGASRDGHGCDQRGERAQQRAHSSDEWRVDGHAGPDDGVRSRVIAWSCPLRGDDDGRRSYRTSFNRTGGRGRLRCFLGEYPTGEATV